MITYHHRDFILYAYFLQTLFMWPFYHKFVQIKKEQAKFDVILLVPAKSFVCVCVCVHVW